MPETVGGWFTCCNGKVGYYPREEGVGWWFTVRCPNLGDLPVNIRRTIGHFLTRSPGYYRISVSQISMYVDEDA
eukprot:445861-Hanusia_phi.AAC.4